jgi:PadR family transcriptional regulator PadR
LPGSPGRDIGQGGGESHLVYNVVSMAKQPALGEFEQMVLLAILRRGEEAYGVTIRAELKMCTGREPAPGALYTTLDRLEEKGLVRSQLGDPTPQRGGRAKRYFQVTGVGVQAVTHAVRSYQRLLHGLKLPGVAHA